MPRYLHAALLAAPLLALALGPASATSIVVTELGLSNGYQSVTLTTPGFKGGSEYVGYDGQQHLLVTSLGGQAAHADIFAWCIDFDHPIYLGSTNNAYTLGTFAEVHSAPAVTFTTAMQREILWLASYGNARLATGPNSALSAAVQTAIWQVEYGFKPPVGSQLAADVQALRALYGSSASLYPVQSGATILISAHGTQELITFIPGHGTLAAVPEPTALACFGLGLAALGFYRWRRV